MAAAVQRQIARDFAPIWGVNATIDPFLALEGHQWGTGPSHPPKKTRDKQPASIGTVRPFTLVRPEPDLVPHGLPSEALEMISNHGATA